MIFNVGGAATLQVGEEWYGRLREVLTRLAVRRAPYWTPSTFESYALLKVDFSQGPQLLDGEVELATMFDRLVEETKLRNPGIGHEDAP